MASTFDPKFCRICGFEPAEAPWGLDGRSPSFDFCACCGVEWGYGDVTSGAIARNRRLWIESGAKWVDLKEYDHLSTDERLKRAFPLG